MIEINNATRSKLPEKRIRLTAEKFLHARKLSNKDLSIAFVGDRRMLGLNRRYRQKDKTTDILSFAGEGNELGELIINFQQIKRQAKKYSPNTEQELIFILIHGLLHLIGYEDDTEAKRQKMVRLGEEFIRSN